MSYEKKWQLAVQKDNINLVMMAMVEAAIQLINNPSTDPKVVEYAASCLNSPWSRARLMTLGVVHYTNSTDDAAIKAAVDAVFSAYAGLQAT